jgi:phasin family protein
MADNQDDQGPDMAAIVHAIEDDPKPEVALDKIAEAVAAEPAGSARKLRARSGTGKRADAAPAIVAAPTPQPTSIEPVTSTSEDTIMADTNTSETIETINDTATQQSDSVRDFAATAQERMQALYSRQTTLVTEMTDLGRGNVEAVVESSRILATGLQDLGRSTLEESRAAYEGLTADVKRMAAIKSPTELMQLQSELARRNLDTIITQTSKNTETMLKLANDMFAPLSSRVSVTVEKLSSAA